jgi:DNA-binding HxlR family transcriptional regulator
MALLDLLGRRMALRILWELSIAERPPTFRALQGAAQTNPSVLNRRIAELRAARLVTHDGRGYRLTASGERLLALFLPLQAWADAWADAWAERLGANRAGERSRTVPAPAMPAPHTAPRRRRMR